jgi:urea transporter
MNPQRDEDLQRRLDKLEAEIKSSPEVVPQSPEQKQAFQFSFANLNLQLERFQIWFNSLSRAKKLVVAGVSVLLGLAMVQAVFKLVASVISLALLAVLVYVGYKFFVSGSFQRKQ